MYELREKRHTELYKEEGGMEQGKKRLYTCLLLVVAAAVLIGFVYYWSEVSPTKIEDQGTLVLWEGRMNER